MGTFNITDNATIHSTFISTSHLECEPTLIYHDEEEGFMGKQLNKMVNFEETHWNILINITTGKGG